MPGRTRPTLDPCQTYDAAEVDEVVTGLLADVDRLEAELDAALSQVHELESRPPAEAPTEILGRAMMLVQEIADKILRDARAEAAGIVARAEAAGIVARAEAAAGAAPPAPPPGPEPVPVPLAALATEPVPPPPVGSDPDGSGVGPSTRQSIEDRMEAIRAAIPAPTRATGNEGDADGNPGQGGSHDDEPRGAGTGDGSPDDEPRGAVTGDVSPDGTAVDGEDDPAPTATIDSEPDPSVADPGEPDAPAPNGVAPSWIQAGRTGRAGRADDLGDHGDTDYFAALRRALQDDEPLGPRDDHPGHQQNGSRHLGPVLRGIPMLLAVVGLATTVGLRPG